MLEVSSSTPYATATAILSSAHLASTAGQSGASSFGNMMSGFPSTPSGGATIDTATATDNMSDTASSTPPPDPSTATPAAGMAMTPGNATNDPASPHAASAPGTSNPSAAAGSDKHGKPSGTGSATSEGAAPSTVTAASLLPLNLQPPGIAVAKLPDMVSAGSADAAIQAAPGARTAGATAPTPTAEPTGSAAPGADGQANAATGPIPDIVAAAASGVDHAPAEAAPGADPSAAVGAAVNASVAPNGGTAAASAGDPSTGALSTAHPATTAPADVAGLTIASPLAADVANAGVAGTPDLSITAAIPFHQPGVALTSTPAMAPGAETASAAAATASETSDAYLAASYSATASTTDAGTAIRVNAGALGTIEVTLARSDDGSASVTVAADRSDTLNVMAADRDQMQSVLSQAGIEPAGRRIEYTLLTGADTSALAGSWGGGGSNAGGGQGGSNRGEPSAWGSGDNKSGVSQNATQPRSGVKTVYTARTTVDITA